MKWMCFLMLVLNTGPVFGQRTIQGKVVDTSGVPLFMVMIRLQIGLRIQEVIQTNDSGFFRFDNVRVNDSGYQLNCSLIGFDNQVCRIVENDTNTICIVMRSMKNSLGEVVVSSNKTLVTRRADRYIVNVENSVLATGNSALDVLQRSPGLWVNNNGDITIRGNQPVAVMVNDVLQRMSGDELSEYLRSLRSKDISKIEIIPNPSAEYEAAGAGGIVHIVLKKARKDGLNASLYTQYRQQGIASYYGSGGSGDYKNGKFYISMGLSAYKDIINSTGNTMTQFADRSYFATTGNRHNDNKRQQFRTSLVYDISSRQSVTLQAIIAGTQMVHEFYNDVEQGYMNSLMVKGKNSTNWLRALFHTGANLLYQIRTDTLGSTMRFQAEYTRGDRKEVNTFTSGYADTSVNELSVSNTPSETKIYSVQLDQLQYIGKRWQLRSGLKYAGIQRDNMISAIPFVYHEGLLMGYMALERAAGSVQWKLGLRAEQTWSKGRSDLAGVSFTNQYIGLFPSLFLSKVLSESKNSNLFFSYAKRLQRPGFNELNPYQIQLSSVLFLRGNPALMPQYTHNFELGTQLAKGWSITTFLSLTSNIISQFTVPAGNKIESQFRNLDKNTRFGLSLEAPLKPFKIWSVSHSVSAFYNRFTFQALSNGQISYALRQMHTIQWQRVIDIDLTTEYRSAYVNANSTTADICYTDIGFSRRMMKGKARLRMVVNDLLNIMREAESTTYQGVYTDFYQKRQTRNIGLYFSYNFSVGKKFRNKQIEQQASEEGRRMGN